MPPRCRGSSAARRSGAGPSRCYARRARGIFRSEEQEDSKHPSSCTSPKASKKLSTRESVTPTATEALKAQRPVGHHPGEIAAMLDAVPDLRKVLKTVSDEQLA